VCAHTLPHTEFSIFDISFWIAGLFCVNDVQQPKRPSVCQHFASCEQLKKKELERLLAKAQLRIVKLLGN